MFSEIKVWKLLYELTGYKKLAIIIDEDGVTIADLNEISKDSPIIAPTPKKALRELVDRYYQKDYPFDITELKLINLEAYKKAMEDEFNKIYRSLKDGTHPLRKEFEEGVQKFYDIANIKFQLEDDVLYSDVICFADIVLPIGDIYHENLYYWCLDQGLYNGGDNDDVDSDNRFYNLIARNFLLFSNTYESQLGLSAACYTGMKDIIDATKEDLHKYYNKLIEELLSFGAIEEDLFLRVVEFDSDGNVLELS